MASTTNNSNTPDAPSDTSSLTDNNNPDGIDQHQHPLAAIDGDQHQNPLAAIDGIYPFLAGATMAVATGDHSSNKCPSFLSPSPRDLEKSIRTIIYGLLRMLPDVPIAMMYSLQPSRRHGNDAS